MLILNQRYKAKILQIAQSTLSPDVELIVIGSRADGTALDGSDIDIVVRCARPCMDEFSAFNRAMQDSTIPFLMDIMLYDDLPEYMTSAVDQGILLRPPHLTARNELHHF